MIYRRSRISIYAIAFVILVLTVITGGIGGNEPKFSIRTEILYRPFTEGYLNITIENRWFSRDVEILQITLNFHQIAANYEIVSEFPTTLKPAETVNIEIELEVTQWKQGSFQFDVIIDYRQTNFFIFGSENRQAKLSDIINVS